MKRRCDISRFCLAAALFASLGAVVTRADFTADRPAAGGIAAAAPVTGDMSPSTLRGRLLFDALPGDSSAGRLLPRNAVPGPLDPAAGGLADPTGVKPRDLPATPNSTLLCLSGLGSLGLWHLGRSSRKLHWSAMPEWYHSGGPAQVGHSTPFEFRYEVQPVCVFDAVVPDLMAPLRRFIRNSDPPDRALTQTYVPATAPRGPPHRF